MHFIISVLMLITAYCLPGRMASGVPVGPHIAACPSGWMQLNLDINGIGEVSCQDRYAKYLSKRIDVWMPSCADALQWGAKTERVWFL